MKKFTVAILALIYLSASIGVTMHMHYCMGKVAGWGLSNKESKICSKCGMEKPEKGSGCCKDKHAFLKNNIDQKISESSLQAIQLMEGMPASFTEIYSFRFPSVTEKNPVSHAPPLDHGIPIYILNCVYRI
jgi:hypothetical protein